MIDAVGAITTVWVARMFWLLRIAAVRALRAASTKDNQACC
jgi:hypothetical protein